MTGARSDRAGGRGRGRNALSLIVTVTAVLVTVYLAFQVIGFLIRFALLLAAGLIALAAYGAWKRSP